MRKLTFTIQGNHNGKGNPMPKLKMTGRQSWTPRAKEYVSWKTFVASKFLASIEPEQEVYARCVENIARFGKPIVLGDMEHAVLKIRFHWMSHVHGDPENCLGSIADALFYDDKNLDVGTLSCFDGRGITEITILVFKNEEEKLFFYAKDNG